ncbi:MAG: hypothetical protein QOH63_2985 [Acidobacteriota bacterium]|jgi:hypothetical protein|nr:hypothetical protein [Acidobacteriota bacterium]
MPATKAIKKRMTGRQRLFLFIVVAAVISLACSAASRQAEENLSAATTATPESIQATPQATDSPALLNTEGPKTPKLTEVQEAVKRVCQDTVTIDTSRSEPFFIGDFNGDGSQDLAAIVRPAKGALAQLNSEYANWIIEDPRRVVLPDPNKAVQRLPKTQESAKVQQDDLLLLILHGYRQEGWHHPYARQTFLLRNVVGENIRAQSLHEASKATGGKNTPTQLPGDVIKEKLAGQEGFLYWTNAKYAWHQ